MGTLEKIFTVVFFLLLVFALVTAFSAEAEDGHIFRYVTKNGTAAYTDDLKRIPSVNREDVEKLDKRSIRDSSRFTSVDRDTSKTHEEIVLNTLSIYRAERAAAVVPDKPKDCGAITLRTERRDVEDNINKRFYIVEDDCGVLFDAPFYPELNAIRR